MSGFFLSNYAVAGMPKSKLNTFAVSGPVAVTVTVGVEPAGRIVIVAVGVPKPAAAPVSPCMPWIPCSP